MEYFVLWIALSVLVGAWNHSRGNSFWFGFLGSALLSPVITGIIVAVTKKNESKINDRKIKDGTGKQCPACAEIVKVEANKCRFCGESLQMD